MDKITIKTQINSDIGKVWEYWTTPKHIENWAFASSDWEAKDAKNDLQEGGRFKTTMAQKDGERSFDFEGVYTAIHDHQTIKYKIDDGREVVTEFEENSDGVLVTQTFEPETENDVEMQREGWQAILDNFKNYTESN